MNQSIIEIDLTNKITKIDVIHAFENTLQMPISEIANWDSFEDFFTSLDTESHIVKEKKIKSLHLILKNIGHFEQACRDRTTTEYNTLINILASATDKSQRDDGINFTFEIANDVD